MSSWCRFLDELCTRVYPMKFSIACSLHGDFLHSNKAFSQNACFAITRSPVLFPRLSFPLHTFTMFSPCFPRFLTFPCALFCIDRQDVSILLDDRRLEYTQGYTQRKSICFLSSMDTSLARIISTPETAITRFLYASFCFHSLWCSLSQTYPSFAFFYNVFPMFPLFRMLSLGALLDRQTGCLHPVGRPEVGIHPRVCPT